MKAATDELGLLDGLETVYRPRPKCSWAPSAHSGPGIARSSSGRPLRRRRAGRRALVPLLAVLALAAPSDGQFGGESMGHTVPSTERPTAPSASGRLLDAGASSDAVGADAGPTGRRALPSFTAPATDVAAGSHLVSTYHVPVLRYHRIATRSERGHDLPDLV